MEKIKNINLFFMIYKKGNKFAKSKHKKQLQIKPKKKNNATINILEKTLQILKDQFDQTKNIIIDNEDKFQNITEVPQKKFKILKDIEININLSSIFWNGYYSTTILSNNQNLLSENIRYLTKSIHLYAIRSWLLKEGYINMFLCQSALKFEQTIKPLNINNSITEAKTEFHASENENILSKKNAIIPVENLNKFNPFSPFIYEDFSKDKNIIKNYDISVYSNKPIILQKKFKLETSKTIIVNDTFEAITTIDPSYLNQNVNSNEKIDQMKIITNCGFKYMKSSKIFFPENDNPSYISSLITNNNKSNTIMLKSEKSIDKNNLNEIFIPNREFYENNKEKLKKKKAKRKKLHRKLCNKNPNNQTKTKVENDYKKPVSKHYKITLKKN